MTTLEGDRLDKMEDQLHDMHLDVKDILSALKGDNLKLDKGLVQNYHDLIIRVTKLEVFNSRIIWIALGCGIAGGLSINKVIEWIQIAGK